MARFEASSLDGEDGEDITAELNEAWELINGLPITPVDKLAIVEVCQAAIVEDYPYLAPEQLDQGGGTWS